MTKRLTPAALGCFLFVSVALVAVARAADPPKPPPTPIAIRAARLLDVKAGRYVERPVVVVVGDRIESVGQTVPAGARVVDLGDRVLLPGLIDAHTHILLQGDPTAVEYDEQILKEYPAHRVARAVRALKIALEHGFTTMRDLETEGAGYDDVALRDAVNEGVIPGPRLKVVGPALSTTGSYPIQHYRPDWKFPSGVMVCDGADGCRKAVREQLSYGTDWVKIYANTGRPPDDRRRLHRLPSQLDEGRDRGGRLRGPCQRRRRSPRTRAPTRVSGSRSPPASTRSSTATRSAPRRRRRWPARESSSFPRWSWPTTSPGRGSRRAAPSAPTREKAHAKSFDNCRKAGVKIAFGTDAGGFPWTEINQAREFEFEVKLGMTPIEAIRSATTVAAELLGMTGQVGTLETGAFADVVAVVGDPLADVKTLSGIDFVMKGGEIVRSPAPRAMAAASTSGGSR